MRAFSKVRAHETEDKTERLIKALLSDRLQGVKGTGKKNQDGHALPVPFHKDQPAVH